MASRIAESVIGETRTTEVPFCPVMSVLSIQDLHVWFELRQWGFLLAGHVRAVDGISFDLAEGEAIAVVGESGCGKTTLMRTILGLVWPTKGKILFANKNICEMGTVGLQEYRSYVGYVQQDPYGALPPFLSVRRILEEPLIINGVSDRKERERRIYEALEEVKMFPVEDFLPKFPHMLSGGQQQRVVIARAMILQPKILVADEPVSMLDASVRVEVLRLLESLRRTHNLAIIYVTHDLSTVRYFSERIFVMYAGKIIEQARVDDLMRRHKHPYTRALMEATPDPDARNALVLKDVPPGEPPSLITPPPGCRFHPRCAQKIDNLCEVEEPPYFETEPHHLVACWLYR